MHVFSVKSDVLHWNELQLVSVCIYSFYGLESLSLNQYQLNSLNFVLIYFYEVIQNYSECIGPTIVALQEILGFALQCSNCPSYREIY